MLIFGKTDCLNYFTEQFPKSDPLVLNFSSLREGYDVVDLLPKVRFQLDDSQEFDISYANYILNNDYQFIQLMKIIYPLYEGRDVYVLISNTNFYDILNESIFKLIQQRYGYISNEVHSEEDILYLKEGSFSVQGLYNLDLDRLRLIGLLDKK